MCWGYMLLKKLHAPITEVIIRYLEVYEHSAAAVNSHSTWLLSLVTVNSKISSNW